MKPLAAILSLSATMALFAANVAPATTYQASAKSKVFHLPSCAHAKKIVAALNAFGGIRLAAVLGLNPPDFAIRDGQAIVLKWAPTQDPHPHPSKPFTALPCTSVRR
jgi:hypothetical protein